VGHYSKDCPQTQTREWGFKVITLIANLAQSELNHLIFVKGKVFK
jgi:hypothetical protein